MIAPGSAAWMLDVLGHWADRRWLRRLDVALARFVAQAAPATNGPTLLAIALTAHLEGIGHTCLPVTDLLAEDGPDLSWPPEATDALRHVLRGLPTDEAAWHEALVAGGAVRVAASEGAADRGNEPFVLDHGRLYLRRYWRHERRIARAVDARARVSLAVDAGAARGWIDRLFDRRDGPGPDWQRIACATALGGRIAVVTGGPGTGKTFTAVRLLAVLLATQPAGFRVALAAPTGKAAARLRQSIATAMQPLAARVDDGFALRAAFERIAPARTLHALLGTRRGSRRFRHDRTNPLDVDLLLVDEASMIHVEMMDALFDALPETARLVLLGDEDQLASVEAGAVLGELCAERADVYPAAVAADLHAVTGETVASGADDGPPLAQRIVRLVRSERFGDALDGLARAVRAGRVDEATALLRRADGAEIAWRRPAAPSDVVDRAVSGHAEFIDAIGRRPDSLLAEDHDAWVAAVLDAFERFRVLTPVRSGAWGVEGLNQAIAKRLLGAASTGWSLGRPIIATRNDADLGIFNGDVGVVLPAGAADARLRAWFAAGTTLRSVSVSRLADVETAFAMTVHRAQGSEFERVALVVPPDAPRAVTRELLYTGITRARRSLTILSADETCWAAGIARTTRRSSGLAAMLRAAGRSTSEIEDQGAASRP